MKVGQIMRAVAEGRIDIVEVAERPGEIALIVPDVNPPYLCQSGKPFHERGAVVFVAERAAAR